jgi:hypothetical protein
MAHAQCAGSIFRNASQLRLRSCYGFPILFYFLRSITRPLAREEEQLTQIAELTSDRSEAEEEEQEREKNKKEKRTTRAVCMGAATSLRMTRTTFVDFYLRTQYSSAYGRSITYLMGGSLVEAHSSSYFCLSHARTVFSWAPPGATQRTGAVWALVVELGPAPPRYPSESWPPVHHIQAGPHFTRGPLGPP